MGDVNTEIVTRDLQPVLVVRLLVGVLGRLCDACLDPPCRQRKIRLIAPDALIRRIPVKAHLEIMREADNRSVVILTKTPFNIFVIFLTNSRIKNNIDQMGQEIIPDPKPYDGILDR